MISKFPIYRQLDSMDCGPTCLRMIAKHYGRNFSIQELRDAADIGREGVSLLGIAKAAERIGMRSLCVKIDYETISNSDEFPFIAHWEHHHFIVVYKIKKNKVYVADPAKGIITYSREEFLAGWATNRHAEPEGIALLLEALPEFLDEENNVSSSYNLQRVANYLLHYKGLLIQLFLGLIIGSCLQLAFPFLTQAIVDTGIQTQNLNFIHLVLFAQIMLFIGKVSTEFIRGWILLHISTRINLHILSDFLIKLTRLPLSYFDIKLMGDIMQRVNDHSRIEKFLTQNSLSTLFSLVNVAIFASILAVYNNTIFLVFAISAGVYLLWIRIFLNSRRSLDFKKFDIQAKENTNLVQLIQGMQEIKLANAELPKRWEWEKIQAKLFKTNIKGLSIDQYQQAGAYFINEGKNILITFLAAKGVIEGNISLGAMLAIQYIAGQLNGPIEQLILFAQALQEAKISLERLNEIHQLEDEEPIDAPAIKQLPEQESIHFNNVSFRYAGAGETPVLEHINLHIPAGKVTAIVGTSGSGKTTLLKLLLKFYPASTGEIKFGSVSLNNISASYWRERCGVVMQDGFVFSDTIAKNIAVGDENIDFQKLLYAVEVANIRTFIESLPLGFNTKIGAEGNGLSQGQKQRLFIARAVYKDPQIIFFDEATNALDANNESIIMQNLNNFFRGRTVIVVAHRLSTVKDADHIVVLEKGRIVEEGSHYELIEEEGKYYELVKNQLELGV